MIDIRAAAEHLEARLPAVPRVAVVLGSGLSHLAEELADPVAVPFADVPGLLPSDVEGHSGRFVHGRLGAADVILQAGRYHAYEGRGMDLVAAPVRILAALGVEVLVLTNAAGGIADGLGPGDLVLIEDHINMMFTNPLIGPVLDDEARFPDMSAPYDSALMDMAEGVAREMGIDLPRGVYAAVLGPSYETAAEVRMLAAMGATLVGMSTVPEAITASALGLRCVAFSMVTNKGTGLSHEPLGHDEVIEVGRVAGSKLGRVIVGLVDALEDGVSRRGRSG